ncbi:hypothetical protein AB9P05_18755 [Roseivirga sp. BDSF3-8]|uniref:hypothetical protein n=1 Tax=Roseivirga sp. BDSF3-8 TaxID=3241598 RepID=UPI003531D163
MTRPDVNRPWNLESFLDSLILELDKARETLAIKAVNRPLTYSVKDLALELQLFPSYDGEQVRFVTAKPGEQGASKVSIQLGSITDRQIRESAPAPISKDDITIEEVEELDTESRATLKRLGVKSIKDIEKLQKRNVDIQKASDSKLKYNKLADIIEKSRRSKYKPLVHKVSMMQGKKDDVIYLEGENLILNEDFEAQAMVDGRPVSVREAGNKRVVLALGRKLKPAEALAMEVMLDRDTVIRFNLKSDLS